MKKATVDDLKMVQFEILKVVRDFCEENNLKYFLDCGTLLGAIRHKGYIPWDDDIDIGMLREDFDKFITVFNEKMANTKYRCYCASNNDKFYYPYAKICDISTILYEPDEKGFKYHINIDLFPYDNAPDDKNKINKMFKKRTMLNRLNCIKNLRSFTLGKAKFLKKLIWLAILPFPKNYFVKKTVKYIQKYKNSDCNLVGNFSCITNMTAEKSIFDSYIDVEFEGEKFKAPVGYDKWLKAFYNDYMQLPPVEKRVSHHYFLGYIPDEKEASNE